MTSRVGMKGKCKRPFLSWASLWERQSFPESPARYSLCIPLVKTRPIGLITAKRGVRFFTISN